MITLQGKVRDYDPVHDTASIELVHAGMIESWMDGVAIHPAVDRSFVVHGADVTVQVPDPHRLCEAIITGSGSSINAVSRASSAGAVTTQTGRAIISIGAGGSGSVNITFSPAFTGAPNLTVSSDNQYGIVIGGLTTTGATITVTGATPNTFVWISYQAQGH